MKNKSLRWITVTSISTALFVVLTLCLQVPVFENYYLCLGYIIMAVCLMTHDKTIPYMDYIAKIKNNPIARAVKLEDLKHNSDLNRIEVITQKDRERADKYQMAISFLMASNIS